MRAGAALPTNHLCLPPSTPAEAPPWMPSATWPSLSTWTREASIRGHSAGRHGSSW